MRQHFTSTDHACRSLMTALKCRPILAWTHDDVYLRNESWDTSVVIGRWPGVNPGQPVHFGLFFDFFANISVPNKSKTTKQRRPDSLRNASWHKSEPAIWVVNIFVNIENKPTYLRSGSILYIEEWHSYWHVGTGWLQRLIHDIEAITTLFNSVMKTDNFRLLLIILECYQMIRNEW